MKAVPITIKDANRLIAKWHRHNLPTHGGRFAVGASVKGNLIGVAIVGCPVARLLDDGETCEVTRLCTIDGYAHLHACSFLYGRCVRAAKAIGYSRIVTYTLESESGASLKAAGFIAVGIVPPGSSWNRPNRKRVDSVDTLFGVVVKQPKAAKVRWERAI